MLHQDDYEFLKEILLSQERLFSKLDMVTREYEDSFLLEANFYHEEEDKFMRRYKILTTKIVDALADALKVYTIELKRNRVLEERILHLRLLQEENITEITINYTKEGSLSIAQLS